MQAEIQRLSDMTNFLLPLIHYKQFSKEYLLLQAEAVQQITSKVRWADRRTDSRIDGRTSYGEGIPIRQPTYAGDAKFTYIILKSVEKVQYR